MGEQVLHSRAAVLPEKVHIVVQTNEAAAGRQLPNLIVGNSVVPELLVHKCTVDSISRELSPLLQASPRRDWQIQGYRNMQRRLGTYVAAEYAAELIVDSLRPISEAGKEG